MAHQAGLCRTYSRWADAEKSPTSGIVVGVTAEQLVSKTRMTSG